MPRRYELKERARKRQETRRRIVEAAHELHGTVGFGATISAVAERAGVERLTVYRHFATDEELVRACAVHFFTRDPLPDPAAWRGTHDPEARLRAALTAIYAWFRRNEGNVGNFVRDLAVKPYLRALGTPMFDYFASVTDLLASGWGARGRRRKLLVAAVGHAIDFRTWHSLARGQALDDEQAVELMVRLVRSV